MLPSSAAFPGAWGWWGKRSELIRPLLISFFLDWLVRGSEIIGNSNQSCHQANQSQRTASWQLQIRSWGSCSPPLSYFRGLKNFKMRIHFPPHFRPCSPISNTPTRSKCKNQHMQHNQQTSKFSDFPLTKKHAESCIKMHKVLCLCNAALQLYQVFWYYILCLQCLLGWLEFVATPGRSALQQLAVPWWPEWGLSQHVALVAEQV